LSTSLMSVLNMRESFDEVFTTHTAFDNLFDAMICTVFPSSF